MPVRTCVKGRRAARGKLCLEADAVAGDVLQDGAEEVDLVVGELVRGVVGHRAV